MWRIRSWGGARPKYSYLQILDYRACLCVYSHVFNMHLFKHSAQISEYGPGGQGHGQGQV